MLWHLLWLLRWLLRWVLWLLQLLSVGEDGDGEFAHPVVAVCGLVGIALQCVVTRGCFLLVLLLRLLLLRFSCAASGAAPAGAAWVAAFFVALVAPGQSLLFFQRHWDPRKVPGLGCRCG